MNVIIHRNPDCGTSRNTLALIRHVGIEPEIIEYLKNPPSVDALAGLIANAGLTVREAIRQNVPPYKERRLENQALSDNDLLQAMVADPILINRPFVVTPLGTRLCRPSEAVLDILPPPPKTAFHKEDGEMIINAEGQRVV